MRQGHTVSTRSKCLFLSMQRADFRRRLLINYLMQLKHGNSYSNFKDILCRVVCAEKNQFTNQRRKYRNRSNRDEYKMKD